MNRIFLGSGAYRLSEASMAKQCGYSRAGTPPLRLYTYTSNLHLKSAMLILL